MKRIGIFSLLLTLLLTINSFADWDRSGHHRLRDTANIVQINTSKDKENKSGKRIIFEESLFGVAGGFGGGLAGGFAGAFLGSYYGVYPGAAIGYVAGNSLGIYLAGKSNNSNGSYRWIFLSETVGLGLSFLSIYLWDDLYRSHLSDNHYARAVYDKTPMMAITLSLSIPTIFGIIANEKTINRTKR